MFDELKEADIAVEIKKFRKKRSLDANAYCWVIIDKIASSMSLDKVTVYRNAIRNIGGVSETVCVVDNAARKLIDGWTRNGIGWQAETLPSKLSGCVNVILYYGSSTYDTAQMCRLIDSLVQDAKGLGIETMSSEELKRITDEWGN
jgi:hypothetical protein